MKEAVVAGGAPPVLLVVCVVVPAGPDTLLVPEENDPWPLVSTPVVRAPEGASVVMG